MADRLASTDDRLRFTADRLASTDDRPLFESVGFPFMADRPRLAADRLLFMTVGLRRKGDRFESKGVVRQLSMVLVQERTGRLLVTTPLPLLDLPPSIDAPDVAMVTLQRSP